MIEKVLVCGSGGWGTALAMVLAERGTEVQIWCHDQEYAKEMAAEHRNPRYLPGVSIPKNISFTTDPEAATDCAVVFSVVPSQFLRPVMKQFAPFLKQGKIVVSATKGIEHDSRLRPSEIIAEEVGQVPFVVLSGPSHAEEVARGIPTTVVAASTDSGYALRIQDLLHTDRFRVYTNEDPIGVEVAGAIKNVISIAGGIVDGLQLGDNTKAALLTRGIVEMARLGEEFGGDRNTFFGLAGIGDLIVSCISPHGRNRAVGERIGRGELLADIVASMRQVAEGVRTAEAVYHLATARDVEMPICFEVYRTLYEGKDPSMAVRDLMTRQLKEEHQW